MNADASVGMYVALEGIKGRVSPPCSGARVNTSMRQTSAILVSNQRDALIPILSLNAYTHLNRVYTTPVHSALWFTRTGLASQHTSAIGLLRS